MDTSDRAGAVTDRVPGGVEPTTKLLVKGAGFFYWEVSRDWRFHPPNTLLKQEGLQLAEASFRDKLRMSEPCLPNVPNPLFPQSKLTLCSQFPHTASWTRTKAMWWKLTKKLEQRSITTCYLLPQVAHLCTSVHLVTWQCSELNELSDLKWYLSIIATLGGPQYINQH